jgi:hypothetical protein
MSEAAALALTVLGAAVVSALAAWRLRLASHPSALAASFLGAGLAVIAAVASTYVVYAFTWASPAREVAAHVVTPLVVFLAVIAYALTRLQVPALQLLGAALEGSSRCGSPACTARSWLRATSESAYDAQPIIPADGLRPPLNSDVRPHKQPTPP